MRLCFKKVFCVLLTYFLVIQFMPIRTYAAAIGVSVTDSEIIVDTGAGLIYTIDSNSGDMTSCKLNGVELTGSKPSHIGSGLWDVDVSWNTSPSGGTVVITCEMSTLTHYYISRSGENVIYMATYITEEPSVGELRYIFRGNKDVLTNVRPHSDLRGNTGAIESSDVFGFSNGYTASKYYGNDQAKDLRVTGATGDNVGVFMAYGNRETSSGGPFFRDIQTQSGTDIEVYNYMNSGHSQTEDFRMGLHGPYALVFTDGSTPSVPDFSWMSSLGLKGWVSSRGKVVLNGLNNMDSDYTYTIGFSNSEAQYWVKANSSGAASCSDMKPGTYEMTVYKGELEVYSETGVTVSANQVTTLNTRTIKNDPALTQAVWRIGNWDGTPNEFLNGQTFVIRHPSDARNQSWERVTYQVGSAINKFPALQARQLNNGTEIKFTLSAEEASNDHRLNIGVTTAYLGGRPNISVNGNSLKIPSASSQPNSRSYTLGTYRGNNTTFSYWISSSYLVEGENVITISVASGSSDLGTYLSAGFVYDCVELLLE